MVLLLGAMQEDALLFRKYYDNKAIKGAALYPKAPTHRKHLANATSMKKHEHLRRWKNMSILVAAAVPAARVRGVPGPQRLLRLKNFDSSFADQPNRSQSFK
jgi:hypothetical protein